MSQCCAYATGKWLGVNVRQEPLKMFFRAVNVITSLACVSYFLLLSSGCSYPLTVKNLSEYEGVALHSLEEQLVVGIKAKDNLPLDKFGMDFVNALAKHNIRVIYPYAGLQGDTSIDVVADIKSTSKYDGSGWNFLINFPGFIVFAPAWNGYIYEANFNFGFRLIDPLTGNEKDKWDVPLCFDIRHAAMNRTWTTGVGWLAYGVSAAIGGVLFVEYDQEVTPLLINHTRNSVGDYLTSQFVLHLKQAKSTWIPRRIRSGGGGIVEQSVEAPLDLAGYPYLNSTAAVLTFDAKSGVPVADVAILSDRFEVEMGKYDVQKLVSRSKMKDLLAVQKFSAACNAPECAIEAGQLLSVEYIIYGSIGKIGSTYTVNVYMTSVEKGNTVATAAVDYKGELDGLLTQGMSKAVNSLLKSATAKKTSAGATPSN